MLLLLEIALRFLLNLENPDAYYNYYASVSQTSWFNLSCGSVCLCLQIRQNVPQTSKDWEALEQQAAMLQKMEAQAAAHCHARGIKLPTQCSQAAGPCLVIMDSQGGAAEKPPGAKAGDTNLATMQMSALDIGTERSLSDIDAAMTARGYR